MAVYKRSYKSWGGALTPEWSRFLVIPKHAWRNLFQQRFLVILYVACFFWPLVCLLAIYLNANLGFVAQFVRVPEGGILSIGSDFFYYFTVVQSTFAFILTAFIGPGLISPDVVNNALPLYFCRPFSRLEYVLGKMTVLVALLSSITWVPGLVLFFVHSSLTGWQWMADNFWLANSTFLALGMWVVLISLLALAISAWVRWKIIAGAALAVVFFLGGGLAVAINSAIDTQRGNWLNFGYNATRLWLDLFDRGERMDAISSGEAGTSLLVMSAVCVWLLWKKIRACEVVRG